MSRSAILVAAAVLWTLATEVASAGPQVAIEPYPAKVDRLTQEVLVGGQKIVGLLEVSRRFQSKYLKNKEICHNSLPCKGL